MDHLWLVDYNISLPSLKGERVILTAMCITHSRCGFDFPSYGASSGATD